ncbi:MAG: hypothetical protein Q8M73_09510 [Actinomycetota bacterium]|nr:hypothetical protein [Actinomycetota bacterium]
MTVTDINKTRETKISQAEKDYWVRTFSSCPEWCDSATHAELKIDTVPGERFKLHQIELAKFATEFATLISKASALVTSIQRAYEDKDTGVDQRLTTGANPTGSGRRGTCRA